MEGGARALIVTDRAQNPTGAAVSATRARALRSVLAEHPRTLLVEDDHGHRIVDLPLHPLAGATRHWAFMRSVAKAYGPDLRLAVLTGDAVTVDRVQGRQRLGPGWVSRLLQRAVVRLWPSGAVDTRAVAAAYGGRRDALIGALAERGRRGVRAKRDERVGARAGRDRGRRPAAARGLGRRPGGPLPDGTRHRGCGITVSTLAPDEVGALADAVAAAVGPAPGRRYV